MSIFLAALVGFGSSAIGLHLHAEGWTIHHAVGATLYLFSVGVAIAVSVTR